MPHRPVVEEWCDGVTRVLPNGITLWAKGWPSAKTTAIVVAVAVGAVEDPLHGSGRAHGFEHIPWRGAGPFPSKLALIDAVEEHGGDWNAHTSMDMTTYWLNVDPTMVDHALDVLHAVVSAPHFEGVEAERATILREYWMYRLTPSKRISLEFPALFHTDPYRARAVIGTEESIATMSPEDLKHFHIQWYSPGKMAVTIAGPGNPENLLDRLQARFGHLPSREETSLSAPPPSLPVTRTGHQKCPWDLNATVIVCECAFPPEDEWAAYVLSRMLGSGSSSPIFQRLREEHSYFYAYAMGTDEHRGFRTIGFGAEVAGSRADACSEDFWGLVTPTGGLTPRRWEWIQKCIAAEFAHAPFMPRPLVVTAAESIVTHGRVLLRNERATRLAETSLDDVLAFAEKHFSRDRCLEVHFSPA